MLVSYGPVMLHEALTAAELLAERGIEAAVVAMPWLDRVDADWLAETFARRPRGARRRGSRAGRRAWRHAPARARRARRAACARRRRRRGLARVRHADRGAAPPRGSTAPRSRSASRSPCRVAPGRDAAARLGRRRRPAHGPRVLRLRDRRAADERARRPAHPRVRFPRGAAESGRRACPTASRVLREDDLYPVAVAPPERVRRRVDRWLDRRFGYYPLAIRLNLRHGFHRERMRPATATTSSTRRGSGRCPSGRGSSARCAAGTSPRAATSRARSVRRLEDGAARGRPLEPPDAVRDAVHRARPPARPDDRRLRRELGPHRREGRDLERARRLRRPERADARRPRPLPRRPARADRRDRLAAGRRLPRAAAARGVRRAPPEPTGSTPRVRSSR